MRKITVSILFSLAVLFIYAQEITYSTELNIKYYADSLNQSDAYINERCVLDIYYPNNKKNFATIVWFHGGGLSSGNKEFPSALLNQGFCIIAVNYRLSPNVKAPTYIEDAAASVAWAFNNITKFGGDSNLAGISGGVHYYIRRYQ